MKKIILSTLLLITTIAGTGQHTNALRDLNKTDYLKKSKNQKTAAWILAGAGAGTLILGLTRINVAGSNSGTVNNTTGYVLLATGFAAGISSIPLFAASKRNKKKGMSISFENNFTPYLQKSLVVYKMQPSFILKMPM